MLYPVLHYVLNIPKVSKAIKNCTVARYCFNREPNKCSIVKVELPSLNEFILHTSRPCRYCTYNPHLHQKTTARCAIHTRVHGWYLSGGSYSSLSYVKSLAVITVSVEPLAWRITLELANHLVAEINSPNWVCPYFSLGLSILLL